MKLKHLFLPLLLLGISSTILASSALFAQEDTILTFAIPDWMESSLEEEVFDEFEAAHPGVNVVFNAVNSEIFYPTPPEFDITAHLDRTSDLASSADVMLVTNYNMTPAAIRAGYFLDLTPLISSDFDLDTNDFFPAMWEAFQRDQGMWGLPISGSFNIFVYRKSVFDAAGVPYPSQDWTFADFADAVRTLTQYDENGEVVLPGFISFGTNYLIRAFLEQGFEDTSTFPTQPYITSPELIALLDEWHALEAEGVFGGFDDGRNIDFNEIPLTVQPPFNLMYTTAPDTEDFGGSLLPGGVAGMDINGIALSAGTEQPELAYELAKYVTSNTEMVTMLFGMSPARRSLVNAVSDSSFAEANLSDEVEALIDSARAGALPIGEMGFYPYVDIALSNMREDETLDATTALQTMEEQALQDLQVADERGTTTTVSVATPVPTPVLGANEIALRFNLNTFTTSLANEEAWDQFLADFAAEDPQVGYVQFGMSYDSFAGLAEQNDCFYLPYNALSSGNLTSVLSLDPFLSADFNFDANDIPPGALAQLQHDGLTYGLPMTIQPEVLWYNSEQFDAAGVVLPENGWTVAEFEDALRALEATGDEDVAPFSGGYNSSYILMLIAAYGGTPLESFSNPPVVNFTDPANVEAIRQVLDLARAGYLDYHELGSIGGPQSSSGLDGVAIYDDMISSYSFEPQFLSSDEAYRLTSYPRGTQYTPVSYGIGAAYISSSAQSPDACYRFLSALSQRPELLGGMPARVSAIDDPALIASQPETAINFYRNYFEILNSPNALVMAGNFGSGDQFPGLFILQTWLFQAFDAYVLEDGDLEADLQQAQAFAESYLACTAEIAPLDPALQSSDEAQTDFFREYARCAVLVDPETEPFFGGLLDEDAGSGNG